MRECPDEGTLQGFCDGQLPPDVMEQMARHIAVCVTCAGAASEVEEESAVFRNALDPEMSATVPTDQLRARIGAAIREMNLSPGFAVEKSSVGAPQWLAALTGIFRFTPQRATVFASILVILVLGSIFAALKLRNSQGTNNPTKEEIVQVRPTATPDKVAIVKPPVPIGSPPGSKDPGSRANRHRPAEAFSSEDKIAGVKLIPGEGSYINTIAVLDAHLKQRNPRSMTPAARAEYERNLKLVDYAIAATRSKAKRNPHDPDAAEFMFAAYQSKIDLLNTVSEARLAQR